MNEDIIYRVTRTNDELKAQPDENILTAMTVCGTTKDKVRTILLNALRSDFDNDQLPITVRIIWHDDPVGEIHKLEINLAEEK